MSVSCAAFLHALTFFALRHTDMAMENISLNAALSDFARIGAPLGLAFAEKRREQCCKRRPLAAGSPRKGRACVKTAYHRGYVQTRQNAFLPSPPFSGQEIFNAPIWRTMPVSRCVQRAYCPKTAPQTTSFLLSSAEARGSVKRRLGA